MTTRTKTLIEALRILARDIQSEDGVANAAIAEAADRIEQQEERIKRLEQAGDRLDECAGWMGTVRSQTGSAITHSQSIINAWRKAKEAKP